MQASSKSDGRGRPAAPGRSTSAKSKKADRDPQLGELIKRIILKNPNPKRTVQNYENMPMQYTMISFSCKIRKFRQKNFDNLKIFVQNIHCGYTLELPCRGGSNEFPQCFDQYFGSNIRKLGIPLKTPVFLY